MDFGFRLHRTERKKTHKFIPAYRQGGGGPRPIRCLFWHMAPLKGELADAVSRKAAD